MPTQRLYYHDSYLREFTAVFAGWHGASAVVLDRTAFYPASGGQDCDSGTLGGVPVVAVEQRDGEVLHLLEHPERFAVQPGATVSGSIDWEPRYALMQHHTGQHLLSALALQLFGWETASVHIGLRSATVEFATPEASEVELFALEERAHAEIAAARPVSVRLYDDETISGVALRKPVAREGALRVVTIEGLDQSACGGTHVSSTAEIGCLLLGATERIRKHVRVEFACGLRALNVARTHRRLVQSIASTLQCQPEQAPDLLEQHRGELVRLGKREKVLVKELSAWQGRAARENLQQQKEARDAGACVCAVRWVPVNPGEAERAFATAFCEQPRGALLTVCAESGAFLLVCSPDAFDAARWLSGLAESAGAKGGGNATQVSGRLLEPSRSAELAARLPESPFELS